MQQVAVFVASTLSFNLETVCHDMCCNDSNFHLMLIDP
jgi:hypothetical protein